MTQQTKELIKRMLQNYCALHGSGAARICGSTEKAKLWRAAIDEALDYCDRRHPMRAQLLRVKYIAGATEERTMKHMGVNRTTYQKHRAEALSTVLEFAARRGLI
ncbi:MAG: hypothetical protein IJ347_10585 [Faecalibacterium sp.]|nr:hypothetical protein [Faecalibacterium sp.]